MSEPESEPENKLDALINDLREGTGDSSWRGCLIVAIEGLRDEIRGKHSDHSTPTENDTMSFVGSPAPVAGDEAEKWADILLIWSDSFKCSWIKSADIITHGSGAGQIMDSPSSMKSARELFAFALRYFSASQLADANFARQTYAIEIALLNQRLAEAKAGLECWKRFFGDDSPETVNHRIEALQTEHDKLLKFKQYVHERLDKHGIPHHSPGVHGAEGCRIGDRLDYVFSTLRTPADKVKKEFQAMNFQPRVNDWMQQCFGPEISKNKSERNHRFLEESLELVQSNGCTQSEARQLVDYVFSRPSGDLVQKCGGVMVTLAALCSSSGLTMADAGEKELARVFEKIDAIREKQRNKPSHSPLPASPAPAAEVKGETAESDDEAAKEYASTQSAWPSVMWKAIRDSFLAGCRHKSAQRQGEIEKAKCAARIEVLSNLISNRDSDNSIEGALESTLRANKIMLANLK